MTDDRLYIKVHNGMPDHPKIEPLSDAAFRLLVSLWCWSDRHDQDGRVPLPVWDRRGTKRSRRELIDGELAQEQPGHVLLHDYLEHQRSAEQKRAAKEQARAAGRAGGLAKAKRSASDPLSDPLSDRSSENVAEVEVEVEKTKTNPPQASPVTPRRRTKLPDPWFLNADLRAWAAEKCPSVDVNLETEQFVDHHRGKGTTALDWTATWRTWMRNAQKWAKPARGQASSNMDGHLALVRQLAAQEQGEIA